MTSLSTLDFVKTIIVSGVATTYSTQILKSSLIPAPFERSPRLTAFVVSLIASALAVGQGIDFTNLKSWEDYLPVVGGTLIVSAATYRVIYAQETATTIKTDQAKVDASQVTVTEQATVHSA